MARLRASESARRDGVVRVLAASGGDLLSGDLILRRRCLRQGPRRVARSPGLLANDHVTMTSGAAPRVVLRRRDILYPSRSLMLRARHMRRLAALFLRLCGTASTKLATQLSTSDAFMRP